MPVPPLDMIFHISELLYYLLIYISEHITYFTLFILFLFLKWTRLSDLTTKIFLKSSYGICHNIASVVYILVFGLEACGILASKAAIEPIYTLFWEGEFLTNGPLGKPLHAF